jgi:phosphoglycolate phosphatase
MNSNIQKFADFVRAYDVVVWDWNGTLLNDSGHTLKVICRILKEEGLPEISIDQYRKHFGFPISKYYQSLGLPSEGPEFDRVAHRFVNGYRDFYDELELYKDALSLLDTVKSLSIKQYVLSAAQLDDLKMQMGKFEISHYFEDLSGATDIYAHGKIEQAKVMKRYFESKNYKKGLYIGDTDHDYEVSQVLGFDFCFSKEGHQCESKIDLTKVSYVLLDRNHS